MKDFMFRILLLMLLTVSCAHAEDLSVLKNRLLQNYPQLGKVEQVNKTPVPGLYEVVTTEHLFYVDETGQYLIDGSLYDLHTMRNLTDERSHKFFAVNFNGLPFDLAIKQVKGNGKRKMFIFTDPNCGFCKRLEAELQKVDNVTIYRLLYPIFPGSEEKARNIWCGASRDKAWKAWEAWMLRGVEPPTANCDAPTNQALEWGRKLKVGGTPTLIFSDGTLAPGYLPAAELEQALNGSTTQQTQ
jgi:thiol:disulfide interchange protein DsbC